MPPQPQLTPMRAWTNWTLDPGAITLKSAAVLSSAPPPSALPRQATVTSGARRSRVSVFVMSSAMSTPCAGLAILSARWKSAPEQKADPSPRRMSAAQPL